MQQDCFFLRGLFFQLFEKPFSNVVGDLYDQDASRLQLKVIRFVSIWSVFML